MRKRSLGLPDYLFIDVSGTGRIARNGVLVKTRIQVIRIIAAMFCARGRPLTMDELVGVVYGDRADGGPENAEECVRNYLSEVRTICAALGLWLSRPLGTGAGVTIEIKPYAQAA